MIRGAARCILDHEGDQSTVQGLYKLLILSLTCSIGTYVLQTTRASQKADHQPAASVHVVSIRFVTGAGLCGCYCGSEIQVSPGQATLLKRPFRDCQQQSPQKYREFKVDADLSSKHWHELEELVNRDALFRLPDTIGCPGCTDGAQIWLK